MKARCVQAVSQAIGRQISQEEAKGIEQRILKNMRFMAAQDPVAFRAMTADQRLQQAAQLAAQELVQEAELKKRRVMLTIQAHDRLENFINDAVTKGMSGLEALRRTLVFTADNKSNTLSVETRSAAVRANAIRQLVDTFTAVSPKFFGFFESNEGIRLLTKAIFGEQTGNAEIDKGGQAWRDVSDQLRTQFNTLGGKIGKLENWAVPQHHSQVKISAAGRDTWVSDTYPLLDRSKYLNDDGTPMNDQQVIDFLRNAWMTLATGGISDMQPSGAQSSSMLANRNAAHREIHYKDADSYLEYQTKYGDKSLWGVITGHVDRLSKEIGMLESYGPNADATFKLMLEKQLQDAALLSPEETARAQQEAIKLSSLYDFVTGKTQPIANVSLSKTFDTLRNWLIASRLGSAAVTALTDEATLHLTARLNNLPEIQLARNELSALNPTNGTEANLAHRAGLGVDTMLSHLNRWGQDNLGPTWSSKMASTVMRMSGLEALDGARRRAFGVTYMSALGEMAGKYDKLTDLDSTDHRILLSKGITDIDWAVWKLANLENWGAGNGVLTPESIMQIDPARLDPIVQAEAAKINAEKQAKIQAINKMHTMTAQERAQSVADWSKTFDEQITNLPNKIRMDAVLRLLGVVGEETDMAVIRPGMSDRFITGAGMERGTWKGELTRSFFLFKSFPLAMITRHLKRAWAEEGAMSKAKYIGTLVVATTVLGAVAQTINDLLSGKDVRNYNPAQPYGIRNSMAAMLKGGALGLYGDFLFSGATQSGQNSLFGSVVGPVGGLVEDAFNLTQGNLVQAAQGKDTNFGAELTRFVKGNTPGASLWYAKAALDHIIFHDMQEYFSPGYLANMQRRSEREFGQQYWWQPGTGIEGMRMPNIEHAVGE
jgi:hypothetical protein